MLFKIFKKKVLFFTGFANLAGFAEGQKDFSDLLSA